MKCRVLLHILVLILMLCAIPTFLGTNAAAEEGMAQELPAQAEAFCPAVNGTAVEEPASGESETEAGETPETEVPPEPETPQEPTPEDTPEELPLEPYELTNYSVPDGYDLWDIRNRTYSGGSLSLKETAVWLNQQLADAMERIRSFVNAKETLARYNDDTFAANGEILADILSIFIVKAGYGAEGLEDIQLSSQSVESLRQLFWDSISITPLLRETEIFEGETDSNGEPVIRMDTCLQLNVTGKSLSDMAMALSGEEQSRLSAMRDGIITVLRTNYSADEIISLLPDGLEPVRKQIVMAACSLADQVPYSWGGKSETLGWDVRWGVPTVVSSGGSWQSGMIRPMGFDCSGFVTWAFINGAEDPSAIEYIGHGTRAQYANSEPISTDEAQLGDLVFDVGEDGTTVHVGIVVGCDAAGELLVCHCSSRIGKVTVEPMYLTGCDVVRSPSAYYSAY